MNKLDKRPLASFQEATGRPTARNHFICGMRQDEGQIVDQWGHVKRPAGPVKPDPVPNPPIHPTKTNSSRVRQNTYAKKAREVAGNIMMEMATTGQLNKSPGFSVARGSDRCCSTHMEQYGRYIGLGGL